MTRRSTHQLRRAVERIEDSFERDTSIRQTFVSLGGNSVTTDRVPGELLPDGIDAIPVTIEDIRVPVSLPGGETTKTAIPHYTEPWFREKTVVSVSEIALQWARMPAETRRAEYESRRDEGDPIPPLLAGKTA